MAGLPIRPRTTAKPAGLAFSDASTAPWPFDRAIRLEKARIVSKGADDADREPVSRPVPILSLPTTGLRGLGSGREFDDFSCNLFLPKLTLALR